MRMSKSSALDQWIDILINIRNRRDRAGKWVLVNLADGSEIGTYSNRDEAIKKAVSLGPGLYGLVYVPLPGEEA